MRSNKSNVFQRVCRIEVWVIFNISMTVLCGITLVSRGYWMDGQNEAVKLLLEGEIQRLVEKRTADRFYGADFDAYQKWRAKEFGEPKFDWRHRD